MNRRHFLRMATLMLPTVAWAGPERLFGLARPPAFALGVITTRPDRLLPAIENALEHSAYAGGTIRFDESRLIGEQVADIAWVDSRGLIDYRHATDELAARLRGIARRFALPRSCEDPHLLRFSSRPAGSGPTSVDVFRGDRLLERIPLTGAAASRRIQGRGGDLEVAVGDNAVRIVSSSCRHGTCVKMGAIRRSGEHLICVPNQVRITIAGDPRIDGVTS